MGATVGEYENNQKAFADLGEIHPDEEIDVHIQLYLGERGRLLWIDLCQQELPGPHYLLRCHLTAALATRSLY